MRTRSRSVRRCALVAGAALALGALPAVAAPAWGPVVDLTTPAGSTYVSDIAVGGHGQVVALWQRGTDSRAHLYTSERHGSGTWSARRVPGSAGVGGALAGFDGAGTLVVVWVAGRRVVTARQAADGSWSQARRLATTPSGSANGTYPGYLSLDVNRQGRAVAAWETVDDDADGVYARSRVQAVVSGPAGAWGPARTLSTRHEAVRPEVGLDRRGRVTVVWSERIPPTGSRVMTASRRPGGHWSAARSLSSRRTDAGLPSLAVGEAGRLAVAWPYGSTALDGIKVRRWSPTGGWERSSRAPGVPQAPAWLALGMDAAGTATLVWAPRYRGAVRTVDQYVDGRWSVVRRLARPGGFFDGLTVEVNAAGDAVAGWQSVRDGEHPVLAAYRSREGSWSQAVRLSGARGDSFGPRLGLTRRGDAVAAWSQLRDAATSDRGRIQARFLPAAGANLRHEP